MTDPTAPDPADIDEFLRSQLSINDEDVAAASSVEFDAAIEIAAAVDVAWPDGRPPTVEELAADPAPGFEHFLTAQHSALTDDSGHGHHLDHAIDEDSGHWPSPAGQAADEHHTHEQHWNDHGGHDTTGHTGMDHDPGTWT
jgi:hypothetical protein